MTARTEGQPRIVVGVDGSEAANDALRWAARQAALVGGTLDVVMTWELPTNYGWVAPYPEGFDPAADTRRLLEEVVGTVGSGLRTPRQPGRRRGRRRSGKSFPGRRRCGSG